MNPSPVWCAALLPALSTLIALQSCGQIGSSLSGLPAGGAAPTMQTGDAGVFTLDQPVSMAAAGLYQIQITSGEDLPQTISLADVTYTQLPITIQTGSITYGALEKDALAPVDGVTQITLQGITSAQIQIKPVGRTEASTSLIYQSDPTTITFEDYVLVNTLAVLPVSARSPEEIATRANEFFPAGEFAAFTLDPVPNAINTDYVAGGSTPAPDLEDALVVYAAFLLPPNQRTPENLAGTVNVLAADADLDPDDILAIPGESLPGGVIVSPSVSERPAGTIQISVQDGDLATPEFTLGSATYTQLPTEIFPGFTSFAATPDSSFLPVAFDQIALEGVDSNDCVIVHQPGLDPLQVANQIARSAVCPMPMVNTITFVGEVTFPTDLEFQGTQVGGLSGITYDATMDRYFILSDDRSNARFYTATIDLDKAPLAAEDIQFQSLTFLSDENGVLFPDLSLDPEGIVLTEANTLFIASEGDANALINPFVNEFTLAGQQIDQRPVPEKFFPTPDNSSGIRNNLAFENLTLTPNQRFLITGTENALNQDGPAASVTVGSPSRILKYDLVTGEPVAEFIYETDPVAFPSIPADQFSTNGLVEVLALNADGTSLLALERSFSVGVGNTIKLYRVDLSGASNVISLDSLQDAGQPIMVAEKELLLDFDDLGLPMGLDNVEGMTFGPLLDKGQHSLILVSDNNFNPTQFTQFIVLGLDL